MGRSERAASRVGRVIYGCQLDRLIASGGFGDVYKATSYFGGQFAIKVLNSEMAAHPGEVRRFHREAALTSEIHHPGVATVVHDGVSLEGEHFIAFEWVDGETADEQRRRWRGVWAPRAAAKLGVAVLDVVVAAHRAGIVHLDVKPENILSGPRTVVLDWGIARRIDELGSSIEAMGTLEFMAPEQFTGRDVGPWSDVRAVGATLFRLITGRPAHREASPLVAMALAQKPVPLIQTVVEDIPTGIARAVDRALAVEAEARPSAGELQELLEQGAREG